MITFSSVEKSFLFSALQTKISFVGQRQVHDRTYYLGLIRLVAIAFSLVHYLEKRGKICGLQLSLPFFFAFNWFVETSKLGLVVLTNQLKAKQKERDRHGNTINNLHIQSKKCL